MRNRFSNIDYDLHLVTRTKTKSYANIYGISHIGYFQVTMEALREKNTPSMCFKCQQFFHNSRFCTRDPICVKCAGHHESKDCTKPKDSPAKCANCGGDHTANHSKCPKNPLQTSQIKNSVKIHRPLGMTREPSKE
ncbi:Nucleic-acid-binding protein from transposon X-element [Araneus ventricosus]|uniref:Nucleic-acid-binding protein from transposon X-element n=1 Tax=Araneus ventricosus TaxID=182803 RepID=A0A4Y2R4S5_ARAVE|nr:Nucleic-acid-binding protein from transposon X-element [Araneus ventricosus]